LPVAILLAGCGGPPAPDVAVLALDYSARKPRAVAVLPFENRSSDGPITLERATLFGDGAAGDVVAGLFAKELSRTYRVIDPSEAAKLAQAKGLALGDLSRERAAEIGRSLGADAILLGRVDRFVQIVDRSLGTWSETVLAARLVDCRTGEVLWTVGPYGYMLSSVNPFDIAEIVVCRIFEELDKKLGAIERRPASKGD